MIKGDGDERRASAGEARKGPDDSTACYTIGLININCHFIISRDASAHIYQYSSDIRSARFEKIMPYHDSYGNHQGIPKVLSVSFVIHLDYIADSIKYKCMFPKSAKTCLCF